MTAAFAKELERIPMSKALASTLARAAEYASSQAHVEITLNHLLLALTEDSDAEIVLATSKINVAELKRDIAKQLGLIEERLPLDQEETTRLSPELRHILEASAQAAQGRRNEINGAIVLAAIVGDGNSTAANLLKVQGLTFEAAIQALQTSLSDAPGTRAPTTRPATRPQTAPSQMPSEADKATAEDFLAKARAKIESTKATTGRPKPEFGLEPTGQAQELPDDGSRPSTPPVSGQKLEPTTAPPVAAPTEHTAAPAPLADKPEIATIGPQETAGPPVTTGRPGSWAPPRPAQPPSPPQQTFPTRPPPPLQTEVPNTGPPSRGDRAILSRRPQTSAPTPGGQPGLPTGRVPAPSPVNPAPTPQGGPSARPGSRPGPSSGAPGPGPLPRGGSNPITGNAADPFSATGARPPAPAGMPPPSAGAPRPPWPGPHEQQRKQTAQTRPRVPGQTAGHVAGQTGGMVRERAQRGRAHAHAPRNVVETGQLVENIPRTMRVDIPSLVEVSIARSDVQNLQDTLTGPAPAHRHDLMITKAMSVRLRAPDGGFFIETASPETQWINNNLGIEVDDNAMWRWNVTPKTRGRKRLQVIVSARTVGSDGLAAETALPDQVVEVKVRTNYKKNVRHLAGWTTAAIIGGLFARFGEQIWETGRVFVLSLISGG